jgi:hypothetical protein
MTKAICLSKFEAVAEDAATCSSVEYLLMAQIQYFYCIMSGPRTINISSLFQPRLRHKDNLVATDKRVKPLARLPAIQHAVIVL